MTDINDESTAYVRFRFSTDASNQDDGWDIDDVTILAVDLEDRDLNPGSDHYQFLSGTSEATPFVTGAAGLLWSHTPGLTSSQVKNSLINGVDQLPAFENKVLSGGRLNLYNSLRLSLSEPIDDNTDDDGIAVSSGDSSDACFVDALNP